MYKNSLQSSTDKETFSMLRFKQILALKGFARKFRHLKWSKDHSVQPATVKFNFYYNCNQCIRIPSSLVSLPHTNEHQQNSISQTIWHTLFCTWEENCSYHDLKFYKSNKLCLDFIKRKKQKLKTYYVCALCSWQSLSGKLSWQKKLPAILAFRKRTLQLQLMGFLVCRECLL